MIILPSVSAGTSNSSSLNSDQLVYHVESRNIYCYPGVGSAISDLRKINTNGILNTMNYSSSDKSLVTTAGNSYISFNRGFTPVTNQVTFIVVVYLSTVGFGIYPNIFSSDNVSFGGIFIYFASEATNNISFYISEDSGTNWSEIQDINIGSLNRMFILAGTINGTVMNFYRDGILRATNSSHTAGNVSCQSDIHLGYANEAAFNTEPNFRFYEAMIYNRALSDNEILQNYNTLKSKYGL